MNKVISLAVITILTTTILTGCNWFAPAQDQKELTTTTETPKTTQTYTDVTNGVTFEYPNNWIANETQVNTEFYLDSDILKEREKEGAIIYQIIPNAENITLQAYLDKSYEDCLAGPAIPEFGRLCGEKIDLSIWKNFEVDGYKAYQSDWEGIPESGEMGKWTYIVTNNYFVYFIATRTGNTDLNFIEKVLKDILDTISFK